MNHCIKCIIYLLVGGLFQSIDAQNCNQGRQELMDNPGKKYVGSEVANKDIGSEAAKDPNEIICLEGYNAPESTDTLRWVSATQSLAYTVYFENDADLAMAAASKVSITMPLHEKLNYAIFEVGSTYSRSSKSSVVASLTCVHDIMLEIPLAHCVRGGMVRSPFGIKPLQKTQFDSNL